VLGEIRLADAEFGAEQYLEAIDSYRLFINFHPTHEMVANGYCSSASARVRQAAAQRLLAVPPSTEKDQSATRTRPTSSRASSTSTRTRRTR